MTTGGNVCKAIAVLSVRDRVVQRRKCGHYLENEAETAIYYRTRGLTTGHSAERKQAVTEPSLWGRRALSRIRFHEIEIGDSNKVLVF